TFPTLGTHTVTSPPFMLQAVSSAGLEISYSSSNSAVATVTDNIVTIVSVGTTNITASQGGNSNYEPAAEAVRTLVVAKSDQSISFAAIPDKTIGDPPFAVGGTASSGLPVTFTSPSDKISINGSSVTLLHP